MAARLIDKVEDLESRTPTVPRKSAVSKITSEAGSKDQQISAKVNKNVYKAFTDINKAQGISNNSALNMLINKYVRENKGLIEE